MLYLILGVGILIIFNQIQISSVRGMIGVTGGGISFSGSNNDLSNINLDELKSTAHTIAAVFPVKDIKTQEDAVAIMIPIGTPEYGDELGVSFDDPINSMNTLEKLYLQIKSEVKQNPEVWQRYINLATKPVGISCEFCCGVGPVGIDSRGDLTCGCSHLPALHAVTLWLMKNTDYTDAEILREAMRWKTLFFPKNMIELGMTVAGGDISELDNLPGMVGGC